MLSLHTNAASLSAQNALSGTQRSLSTTQTRLGTGFRINSAMDDAAGLQIATRMKAQTSGMAVAMRNTQNAISMMQTAEGAFNEVSAVLIRMKDLATQSADGSSTTTDRTAMQAEYDALGLELRNIMTNTSFNGQKLLTGADTGNVNIAAATAGTLGGSVTFQIGAVAAETMTVKFDTTLGTLNTAINAASQRYATATTANTGTDIAGTTGTAANAKIDLLNTALDAVGTVRAELGASSNRLDHVFNNLANISTNTQAAMGRIMDVDYAAETSNMTTQQMLMQAGTAMLKQSNGMSSMVLSLLQ
ncbi:MAG TPA: flagellin [Burkholderiaceae bacterium]|nr:flagellin [Burkholderiaceae bacterium]